MMTRTTKNRTAAALATGSTMTANNVPEVSQRAKVAETPNKGAIKQTNAKVSHSKYIQNAPERINIDSKVDAIIVDYEDNHRASVATLVRDKLNKRIKVLEAEKVQITLEVKLHSLEQERAQEYLKANVSMSNVTSFKDILAIEHGRVSLDPPKYSGKSMRHHKAYKRTIEYTLREHSFTNHTNKKNCTYTGQFLMRILAKH